MTIETLEYAQSVYKAYIDASNLLTALRCCPVTRVETKTDRYTIPPELGESVRASLTAVIEQECDRLKAELGAL